MDHISADVLHGVGEEFDLTQLVAAVMGAENLPAPNRSTHCRSPRCVAGASRAGTSTEASYW